MNHPKAWLLLSYGDDRLYGGNVGYDDSPMQRYEYDNFVPNSKQLTVGDIVVVVGKTEVLGISRLQQIDEKDGWKELRRCPVCGIAQSKRRVSKKPEYRCNNGHEFDVPNVEQLPCTKFVASYGDVFVGTPQLSVEAVRATCVRFNGQMSIQAIAIPQLSKLVESVPKAAALFSDIEMFPRQYWALLCNPDTYRIDDELAACRETPWYVPKGDIQVGDGILIWRAAGSRHSPRGIVAMGTAITAPVDIEEPPEYEKYWLSPPDNKKRRRIWVQYATLPGLPLLIGGSNSNLLEELSVFRAQGSGGFKVTHLQWSRIAAAVGGWPEDAGVDELGVDFPEGVSEGRRVLRRHFSLERSAALATMKKRLAMESLGCLKCECCGFDFYESYGEIGAGFIECHHIVPLAEIGGETKTRLEDLALVCSNCHRMLHRSACETIDTLRSIHLRGTM